MRAQGAFNEDSEDEEDLQVLYILLEQIKQDTENQFRAHGLNPTSNLSFSIANKELNALAEENPDYVKAAQELAAQKSAEAQAKNRLKEMAGTASLLCETLSAVAPSKKAD